MPLRWLLPRYWGVWCISLWLRLCALLPLPVSLSLHRQIGRALYACTVQ